MSESKSFFRKLMDKYNDLCKDLGVDGGACRGCVPIVKFDQENNESNDKTKSKETK